MKTIELRRIGEVNARLIEEGGFSFVELYVRFPAGKPSPSPKIKRPIRKGKRKRVRGS